MRFVRGGKSHYSILLHFCLSCFLIITIVVLQGQSLAQSDEVHVFITGPDSLATNSTAEYTIRITGGPAAEDEGNWSFEGRLEGPEPVIPGAKLVPENGTSSENLFKTNLTAPKMAQIIKLIVNGSSANETDTAWSGDVYKEIEIFTPFLVNISVTIRNPGQVEVKGAVISFYVDGNLIGNRTIDVAANSTGKVYMVWVASKYDKGEHEAEVRINEDGTLLEFDSGNNIMHKTIYVGERPEREMRPIMIFNSGIVLIIEVIAVFFFIGAFLMRRKTVRGRGYYGTTATNTLYFEGILMIALSTPVFAVSQILSENPDVSGDPVLRLIDGIFIFVLGFATILLSWDRTRKKKR